MVLSSGILNDFLNYGISVSFLEICLGHTDKACICVIYGTLPTIRNTVITSKTEVSQTPF